MISLGHNRVAILTSYRKWISSVQWDIAITLNLKAVMPRQAAEAAVEHFWQGIDVWLYGQGAVKRHKRRLPRVVFLEGGEGVHNWHFHAAVKLPSISPPTRLDAQLSNDAEAFGKALIERWQTLREAGRFSKAEPCWDSDGWVRYICKAVEKGEAQFEPHISVLP